MEMTAEAIRDIIIKTDLYRTPELNEKLYLHYHGFKSIQSLEKYKGLKCLWLEGNAIAKIENLENQTKLSTLNLHGNIISKIENLESCTELATLNLSKNLICKIENLGHLSKLSTLIMSHNSLTDAKSIEHIKTLPNLQVLDIQSNKIDEDDYIEVLSILQACPNLRVLYFFGNGIVKHIPHYRKSMVNNCRLLKYLDNRPISQDERRRCNRWGDALESGGTIEEALQAEKEEINLIRAENKKLEDQNFSLLENMISDEL